MPGLHTLLRASNFSKHLTAISSALRKVCELAGAANEPTGAGFTSWACVHTNAVGKLDQSLSTQTRQLGTTASSPNHVSATSVNRNELDKFAKLADEWWQPHGAFRPLHAMNPTRCRFIRDALCQHFSLDPQQPEPFVGKIFLDVGCGGGILSEALARMGATVTGIEPEQDNIKAAVLHAQDDSCVADRTAYLAVTAEELATTGKQFDAVFGLEIIEHVEKPEQFLKTLSSMTKSNGALFISTINRTPRGYLIAILGAEYVAGLLPKGTHDWHKFVSPEELYMLSEGADLELKQVAGMVANPVTGNWGLSANVAVNYIAYFTKVSLRDKFMQPYDFFRQLTINELGLPTRLQPDTSTSLHAADL